MPDSHDAHREDGAPRHWGEAFAHLGLESPPADGWQRLERALHARERQAQAPRRERRTSWLVAMASAAVLALVVWGPQLERTTPTSHMPEGIAAGPAPAAQEATPRAPGSFSPPTQPGDAATRDADAPASTQLRLVQRALPGLERPAPVRPRSAAVDRAHAHQATDRLIATLPLSDAAAALAQAQAASALPQLQQQSRQLEALIAMTRDERVSSAAGAVITGELDATLAQVDDELRQAGLDDARRLALWSERVQLLERLAGVSSTQRWLAAHGERYDALVTID